MDHNESIRKFERLMEEEASHAHNAATEHETLVCFCRVKNLDSLSQAQVKASHKQAKEFRELAH